MSTINGTASQDGIRISLEKQRKATWDASTPRREQAANNQEPEKDELTKDLWGRYHQDLIDGQQNDVKACSPVYTQFNRLLAADGINVVDSATYRTSPRANKAKHRKAWAGMGIAKGIVKQSIVDAQVWQTIDRALGGVPIQLLFEQSKLLA